MYPLSLCLLLLISTFVIIHIEQFLSEKRFNQETETILTQEFYFSSAVKKLESQVQADSGLSSGVYYYQDGTVEFKKENIGTIAKFTLTLTLKSGVQAQGYSYYDENVRKMVKWVERK